MTNIENTSWKVRAYGFYSRSRIVNYQIVVIGPNVDSRPFKFFKIQLTRQMMKLALL